MVSLVKTGNRPPQTQFDELLLWALAGLLMLGLVMVYSASIATAEGSKFTGYQSAYYLMRHGIFIAVGLAAGAFAFSIPVQTWQNYAPYLFMAGALLLILVLIPGIGREVNGSQRWLSLYVINLQPSELMKLCVVLYAASYTVRKSKDKDTFVKAFWPMFVVMLLVGFLLLLEPDMGAFVVILAIAICMLWLGGFNGKVFAALLLALPL
ncbi:MAG: FtsW/RodA/SpoVE family cell cycle protein, partial [Gallionella sp.]|nr:FtsW/RodA/SpoVE family cell cycle protein [Gallionella sp.]